jgi:hypothetical protein
MSISSMSGERQPVDAVIGSAVLVKKLMIGHASKGLKSCTRLLWRGIGSYKAQIRRSCARSAKAGTMYSAK